jgi:F-type H+-transporting ATPase subunit delta
MAEPVTIARPYAKAAFEIAIEADLVKDWKDQLLLLTQLAADPQLAALLSSPELKPDQKADVVIQIAKDKIGSSVQNFVKVLASSFRLDVLPEIYVQFNALCADYEKTQKVEVISAVALTDSQRTKLSSALEKKLSRKIELDCTTDENLKAGVVVRAGDWVIDGSLQGKLAHMSESLLTERVN